MIIDNRLSEDDISYATVVVFVLNEDPTRVGVGGGGGHETLLHKLKSKMSRYLDEFNSLLYCMNIKCHSIKKKKH